MALMLVSPLTHSRAIFNSIELHLLIKLIYLPKKHRLVTKWSFISWIVLLLQSTSPLHWIGTTVWGRLLWPRKETTRFGSFEVLKCLGKLQVTSAPGDFVTANKRGTFEGSSETFKHHGNRSVWVLHWENVAPITEKICSYPYITTVTDTHSY